MISNFSYLWFSTLYTSSFGRTETKVFAKKKKKDSYLKYAPGSILFNKSLGGGGGGLIEDFSTWQKTSVRLKFNNEMLVKYWIIFFGV